MPHFSLTIESAGAVVNAGIAVSEGRRKALEAAHQPIPTPRLVRALVDTGASFTSVEPAVLDALNLTPTGTIDIVTPSTGEGVHTVNTYDVDFAIGGPTPQDPPLLFTNLRVGACDLFLRQGIHSLIGRDVLERCILVYNGSLRVFSLAF